MSWNIKELDENKTKQCISNEEARIDFCQEKLEVLKREYEIKKKEYENTLSYYEDNINTLEESISSGLEFIKKCKEHLISDFS